MNSVLQIFITLVIDSRAWIHISRTWMNILKLFKTNYLSCSMERKIEANFSCCLCLSCFNFWTISFLILFLSLSSFYLWRKIRGEGVGFCVVYTATTKLWFKVGKLFLLLPAATLTGLALFLADFSAHLVKQKTGLCALITCCYICSVFA